MPARSDQPSLRRQDVPATRAWSPAAASACPTRAGSSADSATPPRGGLSQGWLPGAVGQRAAAPVGRRVPGQFAAFTAREDEVAPGAGPARAIAVRPQVTLPASGALVTSASLSRAHPTHRSPAARRPGRDTPAGGSRPGARAGVTSTAMAPVSAPVMGSSQGPRMRWTRCWLTSPTRRLQPLHTYPRPGHAIRIVLRDDRDDRGTRYLNAALEESGTLRVTGHDQGPRISEIVGVGITSYGWVYVIAPDRVPSLIRLLGGRDGDGGERRVGAMSWGASRGAAVSTGMARRVTCSSRLRRSLQASAFTRHWLACVTESRAWSAGPKRPRAVPPVCRPLFWPG